jgi:choline dehydrogenase
VLLLEAGTDRGSDIDYQVPAWHPFSTEDKDMRWDFFVKHDDDATQQAKDTKLTANKGGVLYPRAGTLGGCTSHNAMITVYPHASDWDGVAASTGDASWKDSNMQQYFQKVENCFCLDQGTPGHGFAGWLKTNRADPALGLGDAKVLKITTAAAMAFADGNIFTKLINDVRELIGLVKRDLNNADPGRDQAQGLFGVPLAVTPQGKRNGVREYILDVIAKKHP